MTSRLPPLDQDRIEVITPGIAAPAFNLIAANGDRVRLTDYQGKQNVVLFFMRAFTCIQCREFARRLSQQHEAIATHHATTIVVGPGTRQDAQRLQRAIQADGTITILHDGTGTAYDAYILNKVFFSMLQKSAMFVIDKSGIVRYAHATANAMRWLSASAMDQLFESLRAVNQAPVNTPKENLA